MGIPTTFGREHPPINKSGFINPGSTLGHLPRCFFFFGFPEGALKDKHDGGRFLLEWGPLKPSSLQYRPPPRKKNKQTHVRLVHEDVGVNLKKKEWGPPQKWRGSNFGFPFKQPQQGCHRKTNARINPLRKTAKTQQEAETFGNLMVVGTGHILPIFAYLTS